MKLHGQPSPELDAAEDGLLLSRPLPLQPDGLPAVGLQPLRMESGRDGLLYVPQGYSPERPAPLVLALHGAGGDAHGGITPFLSTADETGMILLAPDSRATTWDAIRGEYGPDISFIDRALAQTFDRYAVDPTHLAIEGFSDGASYAISVGLTNGDLFSHVIAFSPGFAAPAAQEDRPALFISHGTHDGVLPIDVCSRSIVPRLQRAGYDVLYREFDGGHLVPKPIVREAVNWFLAPEAPSSLPPT
jgi:phospholipase/carboxylesterase